MGNALLELSDLSRDFPSGENTVRALDSVDLRIMSGEMVAIVGASGSGKSTLMNILGCLDRPTSGAYRVRGQDTATLDPDALATLRREHFGFIFQRYHLLSDLNALGNVEVPAVYAGTLRERRLDRARQLLGRLGMADRLTHRPSQLSGGQQQRVSIARALMNGGEVILADEPTGALDSHSGAEVMQVLKALHRDGHTIILVTHDMQVAEHADRIIELRDGKIVRDRIIRHGSAKTTHDGTPFASADARPVDSIPTYLAPAESPANAMAGTQKVRVARGALLDRAREAFRMSLLAMNSHRLRTFLTMLGIIIGIASVVSVVALGEGTRLRILKDISAMGTNTIDIYPGADFGDERSGAVRTLTPDDVSALTQQPYVDSATPSVSTNQSVRFGNISASAMISGVGAQYFRVRGLEIADGRAFDASSEARNAQEAVIDENTKKKLFPTQPSVIGEIILVGSVPCRVVAVTKKKESGFGNNDSLNVWLPYTTAMNRLIGQHYLKSITVRVSDGDATSAAEQGITQLMTRRHGRKDFFIFNSDSVRQTIEKTTATMTLLISAIAVISLVVGGIGVMNIMLVSVTERTREIGIRMAVGARRADILQQFLIEAVLVCLSGGVLGVLVAKALGLILSEVASGFSMVYSPTSIIAAFGCSTLIGLVFGFMPARNAARLDPVEALARE